MYRADGNILLGEGYKDRGMLFFITFVCFFSKACTHNSEQGSHWMDICMR